MKRDSVTFRPIDIAQGEIELPEISHQVAGVAIVDNRIFILVNQRWSRETIAAKFGITPAYEG